LKQGFSWLSNLQAIVANAFNDVRDAAVLNYDSGVIRLEAVIRTDVLINPGSSMGI
jgi:hypothetical protein